MKRLLLSLNAVVFVIAGGLLSRADSVPVLTLQDAHARAVANHPRITAAELRAMAAKQRVLQARSAFFPTVTANITAATADGDNSRIAAGGLNNPIIFERNAEGLMINQVITDFGRTMNLTESSKLHARAEGTNTLATRDQILFEVDKAYFGALAAESVKKVAEQTVATRQLLVNQVSALASNKLKSELDLNFATVAFQEGKLLSLKADNDLEAAQAYLSTLLGERDVKKYQVVDQRVPETVAGDASSLVNEALSKRPDLVALRLERDSATKFARAEKDLRYPTISAVAAAGVIPVHDSHLRDEYGAAGVNMSIPLFAGGMYAARQREAELQAKRLDENLRDAENNAVRDVRIGWQSATYSLERLRVTEQLAASATQAFKLAKARYENGNLSIIDLSQAQLNETAAEIAHANARYDLLTQLANLDFQVGREH